MTTPVKKSTGNLPGAGPGRPKGIPNKVNADLKNMILTALNNSGGAAYLQERANDPKTAAAFLGLVGKVLPLQVTGADGDAIKVVTRIELVALK